MTYIFTGFHQNATNNFVTCILYVAILNNEWKKKEKGDISSNNKVISFLKNAHSIIVLVAKNIDFSM